MPWTAAADMDGKGAPFPGMAKPDILSLTLVDGETGGVCLSRYRSYTFNATINDTDGSGDIKYVNVTIEPDDENITLCWQRDTQPNFYELSGCDPDDHVTLSSGNDDWGDIDTNITYMNFQLDFNWSFPDEDDCEVRVNVTDAAGEMNSTLYQNVFRVENDLELTGTLSVSGGIQGALDSGDWVQASENATFTGQTVSYAGFTQRYPANEHFNISVTNDTGQSWYNGTSSGAAFSVELTASAVTDVENIHTISVNVLPEGRDGNGPADQYFTLKVDGDVPPVPQNLVLHADSYSDNRTQADDDREFFAEWENVTDVGSGLKLFYFSYVNDEGKEDNNFTAGNRTAIEELSLSEGTHTLYVWAEDEVGNIGNAGSDSIIYDASPPVFFGGNEVEVNGGDVATNVSSLTFTWQNFVDTGAVPSGIDFYYFSFQNGGGSANGIQDYGSPGQLSGASEGQVFVYVWAEDMAGNRGPAASDPILVDTEDVYFENPSPSPSQWVNDTAVIFNIDVCDNTSGVVPGTIEYRYYNGSLSAWTNAGNVGEAQQQVTASANVEFAAGSSNYIEWRAEDNITNGPTASSRYTVNVDLLEPDSSLASVDIENGAENLGVDTFDFEWANFTDPGGAGIKGYYYNLTNNSGSDRGTYTTGNSATVTSPVWGNATIYVWAVDNAGNIGTAVEDTVYLDNFAPDISGAWLLINDGDDWTNRRTLNLTWGGFQDPNLERFYYSFIDESGEADGNTTTQFHADILNAPIQRDVTVYVWARDIYGHYSAAVSDTISIDTVRPTFQGNSWLVLENGSKYTNDPYVHYNLTGIADVGADQSGILGYYYANTNNSGTDNGNFLASSVGTIKVTNPGYTHIYIWGVDRAGNIQNRVLHSAIIVDLGDPQPGTLTLQNGAVYWNRSRVQLNWAGFSDENYNYRGIAGYYFSEDNNEGTTNGQVSNGGIRAHYYNGNNFGEYKFSNYVSTIDRNWGNGGPGGGCGNNQFSIRYNGSIFCPYSETYTFKIGGDDGVRLYIDDVRILNQWRGQAYTEFTTSIYLTRGFHRFEMHYNEMGGPGRVTAKWSSAHIQEAIIASSYLWGGQASDWLTVNGEGPKNVYIWAQDYSFNIGSAVSDDIFIDLTAPSRSAANISIENGSEYCSDRTLYVNWSGFTDLEPTSGIKGYYISYSNGSGSDRGIWVEGTNHTLAASEGALNVFVWAEDVAGNRGLAVSSSIEVIYPKLLDFTYPNIAFRGRTISLTMNLTDVIFGEQGLGMTLQIQQGESHEPWNDLPMEYFDDDDEGYWFSSHEPDLNAPIGTIFNLRLRYSNPGGYVSVWKLGAFKAANNYPVINGSDTFSAREDEPITVNFSGKGSDREDGNDPERVSWSLREYEEESIARVSEPGNNGLFVFVPDENYHGNSTILVRLTDKDGDFVEEEFELEWTEVNDVPEILDDAPSVVYMSEDNETPYPLRTNELFRDVDGDVLEIEFSNHTHILIETLGPSKFNVSSESNWFGVENVSITAFDGEKRAVHVVRFVVTSVNDPPVVTSPVDTLAVDEDGEVHLGLVALFTDTDDETLLYLASSKNGNIEAAVLSNNSLRLRPKSDWAGKADITVSALDSQGERADFTLTLHVREMNDIPRAFIDPRTREMERGGGNMKLSGRGDDRDGEIDEYRWTSSVDGYLGNGSHLDLSPRSNLSLGLHIIELKVMDNDGAWSPPDTMEINVTSPLISVKVSIPTGDIWEGDTVVISVEISNDGTAGAENITMKLLVDGEVVDRAVLFHLIPGDRKTINFSWEAESGEHNISVDILGKGKDLLVSGGSELNADVEVSRMSTQGTLLIAAIAAPLLVLIYVIVSFRMKKGRRKKVLRKLDGMVEDADRSGVGAEEAKGVLQEVGDKFGIRLKMR